jgi:hypothetical protein
LHTAGVMTGPAYLPNSPSRRTLERDIDGLVRGHSLQRVLYALVELCYQNGSAGSHAPGWRLLARELTRAEGIAGKVLPHD